MYCNKDRVLRVMGDHCDAAMKSYIFHQLYVSFTRFNGTIDNNVAPVDRDGLCFSPPSLISQKFESTSPFFKPQI
jgi:hypothetical protein